MFGVLDDRLIVLFEAKGRAHTRDRYPTVFCNARKHAFLHNAAIGFQVPAFFVVKFTDWMGYIEVSEIPTGNIVMRGCSRTKKRVVQTSMDIEPCFEVPVDKMYDMTLEPGVLPREHGTRSTGSAGQQDLGQLP